MEMQPLQPQPLSPIMNPDTSSDTFKNIIIILLLLIVVLSLLGINVFIIFGNFFQNVIDFLKPVVSKTAVDLEYSSGTLINESSNIVADASKTGIDILNGTMHSVGNLLLTASGQSPSITSVKGPHLDLDKSINQPPKVAPKSPEPNSTTSAIQTTPAASKQNWCLVGEFAGKRSCVSVEDQNKCLSGQVFPSQQLCLNPTMTQK
jgi:hypothetical protein